MFDHCLIPFLLTIHADGNLYKRNRGVLYSQSWEMNCCFGVAAVFQINLKRMSESGGDDDEQESQFDQLVKMINKQTRLMSSQSKKIDSLSDKIDRVEKRQDIMSSISEPSPAKLERGSTENVGKRRHKFNKVSC